MNIKRNQDNFRGCLIGGAIGDALGWPVEFHSLREVKMKYGENGIQELIVNQRGVAEITDDTQLTLFTVAGILSDEPVGVYCSYLYWLKTQGFETNVKVKIDCWLVNVPEMHARRSPGITCLKALQSGQCGSVTSPINDSKGCGCVMRVAPAGLFYPLEEAFKKGVEFAAITHGHPLGYLSAGAFSYLIATIMEGYPLLLAVENTIQKLSDFPEAKECIVKIEQAKELAKSDIKSEEAIKRLGLGWVSEEALAIALYSALKYQNNFISALKAAVNHDGDSDSTGSITGNILGALQGYRQIPESWIKQLELKDVIIQIADELWMKYKETTDQTSRFFH
jgi:ADP-ribosylglycohydrolase